MRVYLQSVPVGLRKQQNEQVQHVQFLLQLGDVWERHETKVRQSQDTNTQTHTHGLISSVFVEE